MFCLLNLLCMYNEVNFEDSSSADVSNTNVKFFMLCYTDYTIFTDIKSLVFLLFHLIAMINKKIKRNFAQCSTLI